MTRALLPHPWRLHHQLANLIPTDGGHDWRSFASLDWAPRYAICILGGGVYDLKTRRFLRPNIEARTGRARYRLNCDDKAAGSRDVVRVPYYARLILEAVQGPRGRNFEAHHRDGNRTHDTWRNLSWVTSQANKRLAAQERDRRGSANPNAKVTDRAALAAFVHAYDDHLRDHRHPPDLRPFAAELRMSVDHLRRIATGKSRAEEVREIRERRKAREAAENQHESFVNDYTAWAVRPVY